MYKLYINFVVIICTCLILVYMLELFHASITHIYVCT